MNDRKSDNSIFLFYDRLFLHKNPDVTVKLIPEKYKRFIRFNVRRFYGFVTASFHL